MEFTFKESITVNEEQRQSFINHLVEMKIAEQKRRRIELANDYYTWAAYYFSNLPSKFVSAYEEYLKEREKKESQAKELSKLRALISWQDFDRIYRGSWCRSFDSVDPFGRIDVAGSRPKKKLLGVATRDLPVSSKDSIKIIEKGKIYELKSYTITNHPIFEHRNYEYVVLIDGKECKINSSLCFFDIDHPNI